MGRGKVEEPPKPISLSNSNFSLKALKRVSKQVKGCTGEVVEGESIVE